MYRREQVSFILYWFYQFYKLLVRISFPAYFGKVAYIDRGKTDLNGPCILVTNHPNTMIDPLMVAVDAKRVVFFLANAGLFKHPFTNWFFSTFYCIPIERPQDTGGKPLNNHEAFARCDAFLSKGGCLYIAPEGSSWMERRLRDVRSGTARICLSAEDLHQFQLGLKIVPVGLTYTQPHRFGCEVVVHAGDPIAIGPYRALHEADEPQAIRKLTDDLRDRLRQLIVDIPVSMEEKMVRRIELLLQHETALDLVPAYHRSRRLISRLQEMNTADERAFASFYENINNYFNKLEIENVSDIDIKLSQNNNFSNILKYIAGMLVGLPVFLCGVLNNLFSAGIPLLIIRIVRPYIGYFTTFKVLGSMITFPLFYYLQTRLLMFYLHEWNWWIVIFYLLLSFGSLYAIVPYIEKASALRSAWNIWRLKRKNPGLVLALRALRSDILADLGSV